MAPTFVQARSPSPPHRTARTPCLSSFVILDSILITSDAISQAAPPLPISMSFPAGLAGTLTFSITNLRIAVGSGTVSLSAAGTASGASFPFPTTSPFTFDNTIHIAPAFGMAPSTVVKALSGAAGILSMPGIVGSMVQTLAPLLSASLVDRAVAPMMALLNAQIPLAQFQDSLVKNGFTTPGDLTIIAVAEGVSRTAVLRIVPA